MKQGSTYKVVSGSEQGPIAGNADAGHGDILHWDKLVGAFALAQIPDANVSASITTDKLALVGMNNHIVDRMCVLVVALNLPGSGIPHSHCHILRARDHPLALAVERNSRHIISMPFELHDMVGIAGLDVVETHHVPARGSKVFLVWGDT